MNKSPKKVPYASICNKSPHQLQLIFNVEASKELDEYVKDGQSVLLNVDRERQCLVVEFSEKAIQSPGTSVLEKRAIKGTSGFRFIIALDDTYEEVDRGRYQFSSLKVVKGESTVWCGNYLGPIKTQKRRIKQTKQTVAIKIGESPNVMSIGGNVNMFRELANSCPRNSFLLYVP